MVVTASPNAIATPRWPMPSCTGAGSASERTTNLASKIAAPQPMKTSQNVPSASTASRELNLGVYIGIPSETTTACWHIGLGPVLGSVVDRHLLTQDLEDASVRGRPRGPEVSDPRGMP